MNLKQHIRDKVSGQNEIYSEKRNVFMQLFFRQLKTARLQCVEYKQISTCLMEKSILNNNLKTKDAPRFSRIRPSFHQQANSTLIEILTQTFAQEQAPFTLARPLKAQPSAHKHLNSEHLLSMEDSFYVQPPPIIESSLRTHNPEKTLSRHGSSSSINVDLKKRLQSKLEQANSRLSDLKRSYVLKKTEKECILRHSSLRKQLR